MADFRVWGRIEQVAPNEFFVVVSTMRANDPGKPDVITRTATSRAEAENVRDDLISEVSAAVQARGDRVM